LVFGKHCFYLLCAGFRRYWLNTVSSYATTTGNQWVEAISASVASEQTAQNPAATAPATQNQPAATDQPTPASNATPSSRVYQSQGTADGRQFTVTLKELRRTGNAIVASFSFTNPKENYLSISIDEDLAMSGKSATDNKTISATYLVDPANQKKYEVMRDANSNPICTRIESNIGHG
jgi:hypothetical protein